MQLALRLYYPIDADLIAIRLWERRNFTKLIRTKLNKLLDPTKEVMNNRDIYTLPKDIKRYVRAIKEPVKVNLNLREGRDDTIICYLKQVRPSIRGDTVKFLFRMCFNTYPNDLFPMDLFLNFKKTRIIQSYKADTLIPQSDAVKPEIAKKNKNLEHKQKKKKEENLTLKSQDLKKAHAIPTGNASPDFESDESTKKISEILEKKSIIKQISIENPSSGKENGNNSDDNHPGNASQTSPDIPDEASGNAVYEMFSNLLEY